MFEQVVTRPPRRTIKTVLIVGSAVVHAVVVGGLVIAGLWQVDKLPILDKPDVALQMPKPPQGGTDLPAGRAPSLVKAAIVKVKPTVVTQPELPKPETPKPAITTGATDPNALGPTGGGGNGPPDGDGTGTGKTPCPQEPCVDDKDKVEDPEPEVETKAVVTPPQIIVEPRLAKGLRISGDEQVFPARTTQLEMTRAGKTAAQGTFKLCVDERGTVSSVRRLSSTGYEAYDAALTTAMQGWRYRPYMLNGVPTPMCTVQIFVYRITP